MPERLLTPARLEIAGAGAVRLLAVGKAAAPMAQVAIERLGRRLATGVVIAPSATAIDPRVRMFSGGHPLPTDASERAGRAALDVAASCGRDETLLVLISGGASALMAVPAVGLTLDDKRATTAHLLRAGADIHALNTVRKHLSAVKGGWLAARCAGTTAAFAISDVIGDDPSVIGSGPTVPDESTFDEALDVVGRFGGARSFPERVVGRLRDGREGRVDETPKRGDARLAHATTTVIGGREEAMRGAASAAAALGYAVVVLPDAVVGEARVAGESLAARVCGLDVRRPACVVASGETTVHVAGRGRGGRNQELALGAAPVIAAAAARVVAASVGTDGVDGPTDAAGAIVDGTTLDRARATGLRSREEVFAANDTYPFFAALGDLIHTGPTGTNVGDLQLFLIA